MSKRGIVFNDVSLTKQSMAEEQDVNKLMERFARTGNISVSDVMPVFGDATDVPDLFTSLLITKRAERAFMCLDANTRERFGNDVSSLYQFLSDPANHAEGVKLGFFGGEKEKAVGVQDTGPKAPEAPAGAVGAVSATSTPPASGGAL